MNDLKTPRFTEWLVNANDFKRQGFRDWVFQKGMLFGSAHKWWGDRGRRDFDHEGLDFAIYRDDAGSRRWLAPDTRIPALFTGVVRSVFPDYLGQAIVVEHADAGGSRDGHISIYAHTEPLTTVQPGIRVDAGQIIATIADTSQSKANIRPHLHYSLGKVSGNLAYDRFVWNCMRDPHWVALVDPLEIIDRPYRLVNSS